MDKRNSKEPIGDDTWQERTLLLDPSWSKPVGWERRGKKGGRTGREEESGERGSTLSLDFLAIGSLVFVGTRGKVLPCGESFK